MPFLYIGGFLYLVLELFSIVIFVQEFGAWIYFLEIIVSGIFGFFILFRGRLSIAKGLSGLFEGRIVSMEFLSSSFFGMLGAFFLILPGILSDFFGIILQCVGFLISNAYFFKKHPKNNNNDEIIDVEIIPDDENLKQEK